MATAQQGMNPQFAGGNLTIPGYRWQDRFSYQGQQGGWRLLVQSPVSQQTDGQTWLYFLCQTQQASASTITAQQAISKGIARTYLQANASIRQLTTGIGATNSQYQGVTRFRDISLQYPPNNGGNQYFYIYVVLMNNAGTAPAQQTAYRCTIANSAGYTQINNSTGLITLTYQDNVTGTVIDTPSQNYINTASSTNPYVFQRQVTGVLNDQNIYYAVDSPSSFTNFFQAAGRTLQQQSTRSWYKPTSPFTFGLHPIVTSGNENTYYNWSRGYYGGDKTTLTYIQSNSTSIWDRNYYVSQSSDRYFTVYRAQDIVTIPTTYYQISIAQANNTSSNVTFQVPIQYAVGHNEYKWTTSSTNYQAQAAGTQQGYQQTQLNIINSNNVFSSTANSQRDLYLWVRYRYQSDQVYYYTGETIRVNTQGDTTPDAPVLTPTSYAGASTNTYYTAGWTTQGVSSGVQVPWQAAGQGSPQLSANGTSWSTSLQRTQGQTGYIRVLSSSSQNVTRTGTVRFAQQTSIDADLSVTTTAGGGEAGGGGSGNYGLAVYNSTGQSVIIDESSRIGNLLNTTTVSFQSGQTGTNSSGRHAFSGVNCQDDNKIAVIYRSDIFSQFQPVCQITRRSASQQYGITVKVPFEIPAQQSPQSVDLWLLRF